MEKGLFSSARQVNSFFWFDREIDLLAENASDKRMADYMDVKADSTPDAELISRLTKLRDDLAAQGVGQMSFVLNSES